MPMITVAIPVYNEEGYLREALDSVLTQAGPEVEVVVSDNASTDMSLEIAEQYAKSHNFIRVVSHSENIGAVENFRHCLIMAETKYFVWLGAHDVLSDGYLKAAVEYLESHAAAVLVYPAGAVFVDGENRYLSGGACSSIALENTERAIERIIHVIRNLSYCTNIHGVFLTDVAKRLPFEQVIGPDRLQLAAAAFYGEIHAIPIEGIRRREVRNETSEEREARWLRQEIFTQSWYHPRLLLIKKHFELIYKCSSLTVSDKLIFSLWSPFIFHWLYPLMSTFYRLLRRQINRD